ncbi:MAG: zinc ribbon domain-containing protein [Bacillota bacterium]
MSNWQRSIIKERREYKDYLFYVADPGPVNAAYSSQECPRCSWVDGDNFKCRKCGF